MLMDMAEGPVVHSGGREVGDGARTVGRIVGRAAHAAVQHADVQPRRLISLEAERQILGHLPPAVADAVHLRQRGAGARHGVRFHGLRSENNQVTRHPAHRRPAVQRIVISVGDKDGNAMLTHPFHSAQEAQLRPHAAVGAIVEVSRERHERGFAVDRHSHQRVERFERGVPQTVGDLRRRPPDGSERSVQVQIGCVNEAELLRRHTCLSIR